MRAWCVIAALLSGCVVTPGPRAEPAATPKPSAQPPRAEPAELEAPTRTPPPVPPVAEGPLYAFDEAVADVLSGPLEHMGTGPWHGLFRISVCAFRNDRVIVVNVYCTPKEMKAFGLVVLSPSRGRVNIYAEGEKPISTLTRADYFTFKGESEPLPPASAGLPPFSLTMTFAELQVYDEARYNKFLPACWGGVEISKAQGGCLKGLEGEAAGFAERNAAFLQQPPEDYYRLVKNLRALAKKKGTHVDNPGG